jgi:hypothetical protein
MLQRRRLEGDAEVDGSPTQPQRRASILSPPGVVIRSHQPGGAQRFVANKGLDR